MTDPAPIGGIMAELYQLERVLLDPEVRRNRSKVEALLAKDFREFGASGRQWGREEILDLLETEEQQPGCAIEEFSLRLLTESVALVTYRAVRAEAGGMTLRSSIWEKKAGQWQMLFHQGTRVPDGGRLP